MKFELRSYDLIDDVDIIQNQFKYFICINHFSDYYGSRMCNRNYILSGK